MNSNTALVIVAFVSVLSPIVNACVSYYTEKARLKHDREMLALKNQASQYQHDLRFVQQVFENYLTTALEFIQRNRPREMQEDQRRAETLAIMYASGDTSGDILGLSGLINDYEHHVDLDNLLIVLEQNVAVSINKQVTSSKLQAE